MDNKYLSLKYFIKIFKNNYPIPKHTCGSFLKNIKNNQKLRCVCRLFDPDTLNINYQCPNPITTINNLCYNCNKYKNFLGFVDKFPSREIINKYESIGKIKNIEFSKFDFSKNTYKKYITDSYIKIKIYDHDTYKHVVLFKIPESFYSGKLIDKNKNHIGYYNIWCDLHDKILNEFKDDNNYILDPENYIPLYEYNLNKKTIYHNLTNCIYRKYRYIQNDNTLCYTHNILNI